MVQRHTKKLQIIFAVIFDLLLASCGVENVYEEEIFRNAPHAQAGFVEVNDVISSYLPRCTWLGNNGLGVSCFQPAFNKRMVDLVTRYHKNFVAYMGTGSAVTIYVLSRHDFHRFESNQDLLGLCNGAQNLVFLPETIPLEYLEMTVWHELGHCALGLAHNSNMITQKGERGIQFIGAESIMYPSAFEVIENSPFSREYYFEELKFEWRKSQ